LFDEIWEKVYNAEQQNQKEKHEMDLKKEIKKLQRLRDQIKTWIGSSDIKDKDNLVEARKLIETKMEQFKICEKETKTKTYSKEGLARAEKLDPAEIAKQKTTEWIGEYIERLNQLLQDREVEIERLSSGKGKKTNKHILEEYMQFCVMHKFHINKLEGIMRLVNNDVLDVDDVDQIKEDLDYYMDSYEDDDYLQAYDEDYFYDALGLDELDVVNVDRVTRLPTSGKDKKNSDDVSATSSKSSKRKGSKASGVSSVIPLTIGRARVASAGEKEKETKTPAKVTRSATTGSQPAVPTPAARPPPPPPPAVATGGASMAAILKRESEQQEKERQQKQAQVQTLLCRSMMLSECFYAANLPSLLFLSHPRTVASRTAGSAASRTAGSATAVATPAAKGGAATSTRGPTSTAGGTRSSQATTTATTTTTSRTAGTERTGGTTRGCCPAAEAASSSTSSTAKGCGATTEIAADASF